MHNEKAIKHYQDGRTLYRNGKVLEADTFPENLIGLKPEMFANLGNQYVARIRKYSSSSTFEYSSSSTFVTDKLPYNFLRVGFIRSIFPNAGLFIVPGILWTIASLFLKPIFKEATRIPTICPTWGCTTSCIWNLWITGELPCPVLSMSKIMRNL